MIVNSVQDVSGSFVLNLNKNPIKSIMSNYLKEVSNISASSDITSTGIITAF